MILLTCLRVRLNNVAVVPFGSRENAGLWLSVEYERLTRRSLIAGGICRLEGKDILAVPCIQAPSLRRRTRSLRTDWFGLLDRCTG